MLERRQRQGINSCVLKCLRHRLSLLGRKSMRGTDSSPVRSAFKIAGSEVSGSGLANIAPVVLVVPLHVTLTSGGEQINFSFGRHLRRKERQRVGR